MVLAGKVSDNYVTYDTNASATSTEDTWYDGRVHGHPSSVDT